MSLLFFDGFDWLPNGISISSQNCYTYGWDEYGVDFFNGWDRTGRNVGSYAITGLNNVTYMTKFLNTNISTMYVSLNFKRTGDGNTTPFLHFIDDDTVQCSFGFNSSNNLTFYRGTGTLVGTSSNTLSLNTWYWLSLKVTFGASGLYEVRVDGSNWLSGSSVNTISTSNSFCNKFRIGNSGAPGWYADDLILHDDSGTAPFNTFLTERQIITKQVSSNDVVTGWTPSAGNAFDCVNDIFSNDDTDYIVSDATATPATFNHAAGFPTTGAFDAVKVHAAVRTEEPTSRRISGAIKIGSTVYTGSGAMPFPSANYKDCFYQFESNPATSGAISGTALNSAQIGVSILD